MLSAKRACMGSVPLMRLSPSLGCRTNGADAVGCQQLRRRNATQVVVSGAAQPAFTNQRQR